MSKRLHNELLQSAINGFEQRRDKALRDVIRYQRKLDILNRRKARLMRAYAREAKERLATLEKLERCDVHKAAQNEARVQVTNSTSDIPETKEPWFKTAKLVQPTKKVPGDDLDLPDFLRRDREIAEQIKADNAERKRTRSQVRIEKLKAKQSGETAKVPLTGKAALKFIKEGA